MTNELSNLFSVPVYCRRTSGGYGNGPYSAWLESTRRDDIVIDNTMPSQVVESSRVAYTSDIDNYFRLSELSEIVGLSRQDVQGRLEQAEAPYGGWFWLR